MRIQNHKKIKKEVPNLIEMRKRLNKKKIQSDLNEHTKMLYEYGNKRNQIKEYL